MQCLKSYFSSLFQKKSDGKEGIDVASLKKTLVIIQDLTVALDKLKWIYAKINAQRTLLTFYARGKCIPHFNMTISDLGLSLDSKSSH